MAPSPSPSPRAARIHRLATALSGVVALLVFVWAAGPVTTNDLFWHIETGELLVQIGGFPAQDTFSYTAQDQRWFLHEWLTQIVFYGVWWLGDLHALRILTGLGALAILGLVHHLFRRELGRGLGPLLGVLLFCMLGASRIQTRPTLFSIALFLALVIWLTGPRVTTPGAVLRRAAGVAGLALAWVNLHSVGLLAVVVYAAHAAGELCHALLARRGLPRLAMAYGIGLAAVFTATLCNPAGLELWAFALQDKSEVMQFVPDEWAPFRLAYAANEALTPEAYAAVLGSLATVLVVYLATGAALSGTPRGSRGRWLPDPTRVALLLLCIGLGLTARRFNWMLCIPVALSLGWLRTMLGLGWLAKSRLKRPVRALAAGALALQLGLLVLVYRRELDHVGIPLHEAASRASYYTEESCLSFDLGALRFMHTAGLEGNAFCHYGSGGVVSYHLYPRVRVFIDSRIDLYRRRIYLDYLAVAQGRPDQAAILERYGTDFYYRHWDLAPLRDTAGWIPIYRGRDGELWLRDIPRNRVNLERCAAHYRDRGTPFSRRSGVAIAVDPTVPPRPR